MILTDREIRIAIDQGLIGLDPAPEPDAYSSTSVDLTLHGTLRQYRATDEAGISIDPNSRNYNYSSVVDILTEPVEVNSTYGLVPNKLILGWTQQVLDLPIQSRVAARVEGKSSLARLGLGVHITASTIHGGFVGPIQLEMINHGPATIILTPGMRICQLIFEATLGTPEKGYSGMFQNQKAR